MLIARFHTGVLNTERMDHISDKTRMYKHHNLNLVYILFCFVYKTLENKATQYQCWNPPAVTKPFSCSALEIFTIKYSQSGVDILEAAT